MVTYRRRVSSVMFVCLLIFVFPGLPVTSSLEELTVGAFNMKVFGPAKSSREDVMNNIKQIILDYDVILVQEVQDLSQNAIEELHKKLNSESGVKFSYIKSRRLGRSSRKEQYVYYYRSDKVDIIGTHQYNDSTDVFEREPFSVLVRVPLQNNDVFYAALVGLHAKPSTAVGEIDKLDEVCEEVKENLFTQDYTCQSVLQNIIIMGDLNADCNYADDVDLNGTKVFSDSDFESLIHSDVDTTTYTTTDCAYDRIIVSGNELRSKTLTAVVDRYDTRLFLDYTQTKAVSDHYPVKLSVTL